jgi:hypothetical protein
MLVIGHRATIKTVKGYNAVNNGILYDNIVARVEAECLRNKGSIPSRGKRCLFLFSKASDQLWDSPNFLFSGYWGLCTEMKYAWSYTSTPPYVFMIWCLIMHRDNSTLTFIYRKITGTMDQTYPE